MKTLIHVVVLALLVMMATGVQAVDTVEVKPQQSVETYDAKTKRACMKKCIDEQDKCNKGCKKGGAVDRGCKNKCEQTRNTCLRACK